MLAILVGCQIVLISSGRVQLHSISPINGVQQYDSLGIMRHVGITVYICGGHFMGLVNLQTVPITLTLTDIIQTRTNGVNMGTGCITVRSKKIAHRQRVVAI